MRTISADLRKALFDENTGEVIVLLLQIVHPDLPEGDIFLSSDNAVLLDFEEQLRGTISRGRSYSFMPMEVGLPEEGEDAAPTIRVTLYDVAQEVTPLLKASIFPAYVSAEIVLASAPDDPEVTLAVFELSSASVEAGNVVLDLTVDTMASEPFPADTFTPARFGGLWTSY